MLQIPTVATGAIAQDIGLRTAGSLILSPPTEAASIIRAAPHVLGPDQEYSVTTATQSDDGNDSLFTQFMEVKETYEVEDLTVPVSPEVKGSLRRHVEFWHSIGAPNFIISVIYEGYRLPFEQVPPGIFLGITNQLLIIHSLSIKPFWNSYTHAGWWRSSPPPPPPPFVINPLSVSIQPNGKKKLIIDLQYVNKFLV